MGYDPQRHHRRSIRLKGYDYSQPGAYFVTLCTRDRARLFGQVVGDDMVLNDPGRMVQAIWESIPQRFPTIELDTYVVMPNHFHAIVVICEAAPQSNIRRDECQGDHKGGDHKGRPDGRPSVGVDLVSTPTDGRADRPTLGDVVGAFKSITTHAYIIKVRDNIWPPFNGRVWQRNYYEHIVRNDRELNRIRQYIIDNPVQWARDRNHPQNEKTRPVETAGKETIT